MAHVLERMAEWRRRRRVLVRVTRAAWRLEQAERERAWALVAARQLGVSVRETAAAAGLSPTRVHQVVTAADLTAVEAQLGALREAGWSAPEDPEADADDADLAGRDLIADRIADEVAWLRRCVAWLEQLDTGGYPLVVNLRPEDDWLDTAQVVVTTELVRAVLSRIAFDLDELGRARRVEELHQAAVLTDRRAERRRRLAVPDVVLREFCEQRRLPMSSQLQLEKAWDAWQAERYRRGEIDARADWSANPWRSR